MALPPIHPGRSRRPASARTGAFQQNLVCRAPQLPAGQGGHDGSAPLAGHPFTQREWSLWLPFPHGKYIGRRPRPMLARRLSHIASPRGRRGRSCCLSRSRTPNSTLRGTLKLVPHRSGTMTFHHSLRLFSHRVFGSRPFISYPRPLGPRPIQVDCAPSPSPACPSERLTSTFPPALCQEIGGGTLSPRQGARSRFLPDPSQR